MTTYDPPLEPGIAAAVIALNDAGIDTFTSCEGGPGHAFPEPTVRLYGGEGMAWYAVQIAREANLPVHELRHVFVITDGTYEKPFHELVFFPKKEESDA